MQIHRVPAPVVVSLLFLACLSCTRRDTASASLELNVHTGIKDVVRIGDSESLVNTHASPAYKVSKLATSGDAMAEKLSFTDVVQLGDLGTTVYFRQNRAALILLQEPFRGSITGKELKVFSFSPPAGKTWEEALIKEFGQPSVRASGGRFGSEALFYSWGDISYNRMGPNEIAIYRDLDISAHRQRSFGRDIHLFKN